MFVLPTPPAVVSYLQRTGLTDAAVEALTPDASDRRYYRVRPLGDSAFVLALHAAPFEPGSLPFVNVAALLALIPLPIPRIRQEVADLGLLVIDDLGDVTLQAHTHSAPPPVHLPLYEQAVDYLVLLQRRGAALRNERFLPYQLAFDVEKLMWEMDFFIRHFLEGFRGATINAAVRDALREELLAIVSALSDEPRVLCHRDYHSRNLMVTPGGLAVIDFQDARMGPDTYDLVSLLRDSYVDLNDDFVTHLIDRFRTARGGAEDLDTFSRRFNLMSVQRNLKALGTFGYQAVARANPAYAQYVPRTLAHVRRTVSIEARCSRLHEILAPLIPELV